MGLTVGSKGIMQVLVNAPMASFDTLPGATVEIGAGAGAPGMLVTASATPAPAPDAETAVTTAEDLVKPFGFPDGNKASAVCIDFNSTLFAMSKYYEGQDVTAGTIARSIGHFISERIKDYGITLEQSNAMRKRPLYVCVMCDNKANVLAAKGETWRKRAASSASARAKLEIKHGVFAADGDELPEVFVETTQLGRLWVQTIMGSPRAKSAFVTFVAGYLMMTLDLAEHVYMEFMSPQRCFRKYTKNLGRAPGEVMDTYDLHPEDNPPDMCARQWGEADRGLFQAVVAFLRRQPVMGIDATHTLNIFYDGSDTDTVMDVPCFYAFNAWGVPNRFVRVVQRMVPSAMCGSIIGALPSVPSERTNASLTPCRDLTATYLSMAKFFSRDCVATPSALQVYNVVALLAFAGCDFVRSVHSVTKDVLFAAAKNVFASTGELPFGFQVRAQDTNGALVRLGCANRRALTRMTECANSLPTGNGVSAIAKGALSNIDPNLLACTAKNVVLVLDVVSNPFTDPATGALMYHPDPCAKRDGRRCMYKSDGYLGDPDDTLYGWVPDEDGNPVRTYGPPAPAELDDDFIEDDVVSKPRARKTVSLKRIAKKDAASTASGPTVPSKLRRVTVEDDLL